MIPPGAYNRVVKLTFHGAAGEVTGSCFHVEAPGCEFLLDCGMFQGGRSGARRNAAKWRFRPEALRFVLLSHAHIDHSGLLPRLVASGFRGRIHCTPATADLLGVMLPDSAYLQEKEAERDGHPPVYTVEQARRALRQLDPVDTGVEFAPGEGVRAILHEAGHILGSAIVEVRASGRTLVYSGDLGQPGHPMMPAPAPVRAADLLLIESTYGDRLHKSHVQTLDEFAFVLNDTLASRRGNVVIPSFAVGRTQDILAVIAELRQQGRVPPMAIYVDSPMASAATRISARHGVVPPLEGVRFTESLEDSMRINGVRAGAVIISASGMCEGGRVKHHLRYNLGRPECAIVFAGFQAAGTLGRRIVDGARSVRIFGESYAVRAKVFTIGGLSAHADRDALLAWAGHFREPPGQCWVVHGEPLSALALRDALVQKPGWRASVPVPGQQIDW